MAGGRIGGQGSPVQRGIWVFVALCIVVAVWNSFPHDPKGFVGELRHKSDQLRGVAVNVSTWVDGLINDQQAHTKAPAQAPAASTAK